MKPKHVRKLLMSEIKSVADNPQTYCYNPHTDFTRKRKFTMERILSGIIGMESGSLTNELLDLFNASTDTPTASAFIQQRSKIKPEAFETIFKNFSKEIMKSFDDDMPIFAIDGLKIQIATNPSDVTSPDLEAIIAKNLIPIRPDRHRDRNLCGKIYNSFLYRVA